VCGTEKGKQEIEVSGKNHVKGGWTSGVCGVGAGGGRSRLRDARMHDRQGCWQAATSKGVQHEGAAATGTPQLRPAAQWPP
jgi:hypothetical protein